MKKDVRDYLKIQKGIMKIEDVEQDEQCKTCLFHNHEKVCQIHGLKTHVNDVCSRYKFPIKHKIYLAGRLS